ncbi:hypothetical protein CUMW_017380, partial [Citrus unshiu]
MSYLVLICINIIRICIVIWLIFKDEVIVKSIIY